MPRTAELHVEAVKKPVEIEPHFMFNTLAKVHSLIEHDVGKAKRMLESLTNYLRSSTIQLRGDDGTLHARY